MRAKTPIKPPARKVSKAPTEAERRAAAEAARKELATQFLHDFVRQAWHVIEPEEPFVDGWHIKALCEHLEAVADGRIKQLLVNVPPGTMKSLLVCVFWPAWVWITKPGKRFMFSSYAENLSLRDSMRTRDLVVSEWYQNRWPTQLKEDQNAKGRFDTSAGGWRMVGSITGKGTGEHPDFNCVDDPHNVLQAESDAERQTVTRWFEGVYCTRGEVRNVKRVLVMQRLHALDCAGVALGKGGWTHICLPMKYEAPELQPDGTTKPRMLPTPLGFQDPRTKDGELLWPAKYSAEKVANLEVNLGLYNTAGQLQQRPSPRGGGKFQREWFRIITAVPKLNRLVRYFDKAGTKGGTGAETAGVLMGEFTDEGAGLAAMRKKFVVLDVIAGRWQAAEREAVIKQTALADKGKWGYVETWVEQEPGSGGKESAESTVANLDGFTCHVEKVTGSKEVRAEPMASAASVGKVLIYVGAWNAEFLDELSMFPMGKLKDQVDGASGAYNKLNVATGAFGSSSEVTTAGVGLPDPDPIETDDLQFDDATID